MSIRGEREVAIREQVGMLKGLHLTQICRMKRPESELTRWTKAMSVLSIMQVLHQPLKCPYKFGVIRPDKPGNKQFPVMISTNLRTPVSSEKNAIQLLNEDGMVDCLERLVHGCKGPTLSGIEAETLDVVLRDMGMPKLQTHPGSALDSTTKRLAASYKHAVDWYVSTVDELRTRYGRLLAARIAPEESGLGKASSLTKHKILSTILRNVPDGKVGADELDTGKLRHLVETHRINLAAELFAACSASVVCSILDATARIISQAEMEGLRHLQRIGEPSVRKFMYYIDAIGRKPIGEKEREGLHRKLKKLLPADAYSELFPGLPGAIATAAPPPSGPGAWMKALFQRVAAAMRRPREKKQDAPVAVEVKPVDVKKDQPVPGLPKRRLGDREQMEQLVAGLPDVPKDFVEKCFRDGMRRAERIREKYVKVTQHVAWKSERSRR